MKTIIIRKLTSLIAFLRKEPVVVLSKKELIDILSPHADKVIDRCESKVQLVWGATDDIEFTDEVFKKQTKI